jgi:hypothetical protein
MKKAMIDIERSLTRDGDVSEDLYGILFSFKDEPQFNEDQEEIKRILESVPIIRRMTKVRNEIAQRQDQLNTERYNRGELFKATDLLGQDYYKRGEEAGSSSTDIPRIRVIKILKIEIQDDSEEGQSQRFITTLLTAVTLSVIGQWLFGRRNRRNRTQSTPTEPQQEEEESEDYEVIEEPTEEVEEVIEELIEEVEEIAAEPIEEAEEVQEREAPIAEDPEEQRERPPNHAVQRQRENSRGRKLWITNFGKKYHLKRNCQGLNGYRSFEKNACHECRDASQRVLVFNPTQPSIQSETEISFGATTYYHHKECRQFYGQKKNLPICVFCEDEERVLNYARNMIPAEND